jgi:hypothetical protein
MTTGSIHSVATLGTIVSSAPQAALLEALRQLRPQFETKLEEIPGDFGPAKHYRVAIEVTGDAPSPQQVSPWLSLKSALMARFPADKPGAVIAIDP